MILKTALLTSVSPTLWIRSQSFWISTESLSISLLSRTNLKAVRIGTAIHNSKNSFEEWMALLDI